MAKAISLRVQNLQAHQARKVVKQIETPCPLTPSCGGQSADREEKRVRPAGATRSKINKEQLDLINPNQRGLSEIFYQRPSYLTCMSPIPHAD